MIRATIELTPLRAVGAELRARAVPIVHVADGLAVVMTTPAQLRALPATVIIAAEEASGMARVAELLAGTEIIERQAA